MNCKPGDLAIIICDPHCGGVDIGKIVEVIRPAPDGEIDEWECRGRGLSWASIGNKDLTVGDIPDAWLRPLNGADGEDEMLRITGKPQEVNALKVVR